jgi:hypothetical protein
MLVELEKRSWYISSYHPNISIETLGKREITITTAGDPGESRTNAFRITQIRRFIAETASITHLLKLVHDTTAL